MSGQIEVPFLDGMKVGLGYDALTGAATKSTAVEGTSLTAPAQASGQIVKTTLQIAQESSVLHQALGIDVEASAGNLIADASAKFKFANDIAVNSFSQYVVVGVEVFNATLTLDSPALTAQASALLAASNKGRFRDRFGDLFILGIKTGGEYFAVYKVESMDTVERTTIAGEIHARAGAPVVAGGSLDVSISNDMAKSKSKLDVSVYVYQAGGNNIATETTLDAIMQKAHLFPTLVGADQGVPYSVLIHDYTELKLPGDGVSFMDIRNQQDVLNFNANLLDGFKTVVNDIDFVRKNIHDFKNSDGSPASDEVLGKARRDCLQEMDDIRTQMSKCAMDATTCSRIMAAPEDFRKLLPVIGASSRVTVPNLLEFNIMTIHTVHFDFTPGAPLPSNYVDFTKPFVSTPLVLDGEFGNLSYVADLAAEDIHPVPFVPGVFVTAQDPPGGTVVSKGSTVKLKLRNGPLS